MEKHDVQLTLPQFSLMVDLLAKVKGIAAAEAYFDTLLTPEKNRFSYGAMLNCYCKELMEDKALDLFKLMEELNFAASTLNYNNLMIMYLKIGKPEKVQQLSEEMKQRKIEMDSYTFNILIKSYGSKDDTEGVERVWQEMLDSTPSLCNWTSYSNLAVHYVQVGLYEKAESALKKLESLLTRPSRVGYHFLISLYAGTSNRGELQRVWESLKKAFSSTTNNSYCIMLQSLSRLGDIEGLTQCFREWESQCKTADYRLAKPVIDAYLKRGMIEEALNLYDECAAKNSQPLFGCIELLIIHFLKIGQVDKSLEFVKAAVSASVEDKEWNPPVAVTAALCMHFEESKDVESAKALFQIMKEGDSSRRTAYLLLLKTYVAAGETAPEMRKMLEDDKIDLDAEFDQLLDKVSPSSPASSTLQWITKRVNPYSLV